VPGQPQLYGPVEGETDLMPWYAGISMKRTTVKLSDDLDARLRHEAQRTGTTIAEVTRSALEARLGVGPRRSLGAAGAGRSGQSDISERIEEIISAEIKRSP
jgi:predicted transcriptional regulator